MTTHATKSSRRAERLGTYLGETLRLVCLVRHWPSLGITRDRPLYGLKNGSGKVVARSQNKASLLEMAARNYNPVKDETK